MHRLVVSVTIIPSKARCNVIVLRLDNRKTKENKTKKKATSNYPLREYFISDWKETNHSKRNKDAVVRQGLSIMIAYAIDINIKRCIVLVYATRTDSAQRNIWFPLKKKKQKKKRKKPTNMEKSV